ncbi:MAG TPA: hypothetical protein VES42_25430 [Pilimelia sp.]|nr:hypothetical protein [Pilimelia sp.]
MGVRHNRIVMELLSLGLPTEDYAVFGSGPLLAHGLRSDVRDLDVLARGRAWERALRYGTPRIPPSGNGRMVVLFDGRIEIFDEWVSADWNVDELIDSADIVDGIRFIPLATVLRWKKSVSRAKDRQDVTAIEQSLRTGA